MPLFSDTERTYEGPPAAGETHFSYLDRSARSEARRIREFLANCLENYPANDRAELESRLRSDNRTHEAALFELMVHELLLRAGHTILAVEPKLDHTTRSPDFLVQASTGERFYLECAVATGQTDAEVAAEKRLQEALDAAETIPSPHHILSLEVDGRPTATVTISRLRAELSSWIDALPKDESAKEAGAFSFEEHGLTLKFTVWQFQKEVRDEGRRSIGITFFGVHSSQPGADLRGALLRKAKRYGELDAPYVVAVNTLDTPSFERELFDVLLGSPTIVVRNYEDGRIETFDERAADGVWTNGSRPRKQGLSAVWSFDGLSAWNPTARSVQLVRNPWATRPLFEVNLLSEAWNPVDGEFKKSGETVTREAMGLNERWPETD